MVMSAKKQAEYGTDVGRALDAAFNTPSVTVQVELEGADALRLIIFSDQHKGQRDGADDFRRCERAYNAAIGYYDAAGYQLAVLGDVEELWECRAARVIRAYPTTYALEARFARAGRYWRVWGNHDDYWSSASAVARHLPGVGLDVPVWASMKLEVAGAGIPLGTLFLVHGHQGTAFSDRFGWLSRLAVRYVWRNIQRLTRRPSTTAATDWELREAHDTAMYHWARSRAADAVILIAGHTHRPVFESLTHPDRIEQKLEAARQALADHPQDPDKRDKALLLAAELEWVQVEQARQAAPRRMETPSYFNTGCCCFGDGDVTGIEIADGWIRLVRWPDDEGRARPKLLESARLADVFARVLSAPAVRV